MSIIGFLGNAFKPATELIDNLHTSDEEKLLLRNEFMKLQNIMNSKLLEVQAKIITSEQAGSVLQRNWRPVAMITFLFLIVCDVFGLLEFRLSDNAWDLLKLGLGGYVVGRSVEKVVPSILGGLKK
jgi:hypothetical protein